MGFCDASMNAEMIIGKLKRCKKCGEPKEFHAVLFGKDKIFSCPCRCEIEKRDARQAAAAELERQRDAAERRAALPKSLRWSTFDTDDHADPVAGAVVRNYYRKFDGKGGLLIHGPAGTGKTFFAACVANRLIDDGKTVIYISAPAVALWRQAETKLKEIRRADLVILDDFGSEGIRAKNMINIIIDARYNDNKSMIVTSNLTPAELKSGGRTTSRLFEMCYPVSTCGPDRRKIKLKERVQGGKQRG